MTTPPAAPILYTATDLRTTEDGYMTGVARRRRDDVGGMVRAC